MKPRTPSFWFIAVLLGLLALSPAHAGMTPGEVKAFNDNKAKAENGSASSQSLLGYYYNNGLGVAKNNLQAVYWFRKAAAQGDTYAEYILGMRYAIGDGVAKDVIEAYAYLSLAGETNKVRSLETKMTPDQIATGQKRALELKKEIAANIAAKKTDSTEPPTVPLGSTPRVTENPYKTKLGTKGTYLKFLQDSALSGQAEAQYYLGMIYRTGSHGVAKDVPVSVTWLTKSAEQGHSKAQYYLGRTYFDFDGNTSGVAKDTRNAVSWWRKAAAQGDADAQEALGFCYAQGGGGLVKNEIEAYAYQILASRSNASAVASREKFEASLTPESLRAGVARSKVLQTAPVVTANSAAPASGVKAPPAEVKAIQDLKAVAAKGDRTAQFTLGIYYANGSEGLARDSVEAVKWYRMAADQGHVTAQYYLGRRYASGSGVAKDIVQAVAWYRKAADQGYAEAQFKLGTYYSDGVDATPDQIQAVAWYRKAADQGLVEAQYILGNSYAKGEGVAKDQLQSLRWYRIAASQGHSGAQLNLGNSYYTGTPALPQDFVQAAKWWRKTAELGNAEAQFKLGNCYAKGTGVSKDEIEAYAYWSIAGRFSDDARVSLAVLEKQMSAGKIAVGQKRTKELQKEISTKMAAKRAADIAAQNALK